MDSRQRIRQRIAAWARRRQGEDGLPLVLASRRLYILPTRTGIALAVVLFVMLVAGLNYGNSLALLMTFTLASFALVAMFDCHRNLAGLTLQAVSVSPAFAGEQGEIELQFSNQRATPRYALCIRCADAQAAPVTSFSVGADSSTLARVAYIAINRGLQRIDRLELSTTAPLGLFRTWTWLHLPLTAVIYPRPQRLSPLPPPLAAARGGTMRNVAGAEQDWAWLRSFNVGDSPRRIAWKAFARGAPLLVAHYDAPAGSVRRFDFDQVQGRSLEQRLSQLCAWIIDSEQRGEAYGLNIAGRQFAVQIGAAHKRACLEALAHYGL